MNVYTTDKIRNVVLLGHGGCGKTSLTEAMAYLSGITSRMGNIEDGNTISDFDKEEIKRKCSIHMSLVPIEWQDVKINILDTPAAKKGWATSVNYGYNLRNLYMNKLAQY